MKSIKPNSLIASLAILILALPLYSCAPTQKSGEITTQPESAKKQASVPVKECSFDQKIINSGRAKAKQLGLNPIPMCKNERETTIAAGTRFNISGGGFSLVDKDMIINAGTEEQAIDIEGITINRGEYIVIENNKARKGSGKL